MIERFHDKHRRAIGYSEPGYPTVIVRLHLAGVAAIVPPPPRAASRRVRATRRRAGKGRGRPISRNSAASPRCPVYDGERFGAGDVIGGPCIVEERMTTLVLPPGETVAVDSDGSYTTMRES